MSKRLLAAVLALTILGAFASPSWAARLKEGDTVPEMSFSMLSGKTVKLADLAKGNSAVVITFIQTACSTCKGEIIELNKLVKSGKGKVAVLPIAVDMRSGKDFLENYKSENAVDFDFGIDPKFSIPVQFGISFTPASIVIKDGKVFKILRGYDEEVSGELAKLFN